MTLISYNIPHHLLGEYKDKRVVVRIGDQNLLQDSFTGGSIPDSIEYLQVLAKNSSVQTVDALGKLSRPVPVDIVLTEPANEYPRLYNFCGLIDKAPVRVTVPVSPGFSKAVKLALALQFSVKLLIGQPDPSLIEEMKAVLNDYLHKPNVSQPIEYFHSIFLAFYNDESANLWFIQEDDPDKYRYISDDGAEAVSPRFGGVDPYENGSVQPDANSRSNDGGTFECDGCEYMPLCGGYFKWPDAAYSCNGVRSIFEMIRIAADELKDDVAQMNAALDEEGRTK